MEIPIEAQVICSDGSCGKSICALINPVSEEVTHLVVKVEPPSEMEYMVPIVTILLTTREMIELRCTKAELEDMEPFNKTEFIEQKITTDYAVYSEPYGMGTHYLWPYVSPERTIRLPVNHPQIPPGELAVRRGARVEALDGEIGHIDEFMINPENGHIIHLVMREGHLWGQKDVIIPVSAIKEAQKNRVTLNIDKQQVESLPTFNIYRHWAE